MKKLMFAAAAIAAGVALADISSANVVGYYNVDVKAGKFSMVALNIDPMNEGKTYTLDELFPVGANSTPYGTAGGADQIQTWDHANQTYRYFYLYKKTVGTGKEKNNKWVENVEGQPLLETDLDVSEGFFFYKQKAGEIEFKPGLKL